MPGTGHTGCNNYLLVVPSERHGSYRRAADGEFPDVDFLSPVSIETLSPKSLANGLQMALFFFLPVVLALFLGLMYWHLNESPALKKLVDEVVNLKSACETQSPIDRCSEIAHKLDIIWTRWDPTSDEDLNFECPSVWAGTTPVFFGPMDMQVDDDQILVYDMRFASINRHKKNPIVSQTVISIRPPELELPSFILRRHKRPFGTWRAANAIKTGTALDNIFETESLTKHRVQALFQSPLGTEHLIPFLINHEWTVEWTGKTLHVFQFGKLIRPHEIANTALEVSEFFELLKSGPTEVDFVMKRFIKKALRK